MTRFEAPTAPRFGALLLVALTALSTGCAQWVAIAPEDTPRLSGRSNTQVGERYSARCVGPNGLCPVPVTRRQAKANERRTLSFTMPEMDRRTVEVMDPDGRRIEVQAGRDLRITSGDAVYTVAAPFAASIAGGQLRIENGDGLTEVPLRDIDQVEVAQSRRAWWIPVVAIGGTIAVVAALVALGP